MMARYSVHGSRAQGRVESAFEHRSKAFFTGSSMSSCVYPTTRTASMATSMARRPSLCDGMMVSSFKADQTLVGRASLPSGGSEPRCLGSEVFGGGVSVVEQARPGRTASVAVLPRSRKASWPVRIRAANWPLCWAPVLSGPRHDSSVLR